MGGGRGHGRKSVKLSRIVAKTISKHETTTKKNLCGKYDALCRVKPDVVASADNKK